MGTIDRVYSRKVETYYKKNYENATYLIIHDYQLIKGLRVISLDKPASTEIYSISISKSTLL